MVSEGALVGASVPCEMASVPMNIHSVVTKPVVSEGPVPDAGDTVRERDARQAGAVTESLRPDAGHRISFDGAWNHQFSGGLSITICDGDLAIGRDPSQRAFAGDLDIVDGPPPVIPPDVTKADLQFVSRCGKIRASGEQDRLVHAGRTTVALGIIEREGIRPGFAIIE